ncbi:MAG TPA: IclR family transcriptional regulator, partial [Acidimicrobiales bacterium]|nr:IclR family transcriptional regulator [Acidimicrobiales bacterium]
AQLQHDLDIPKSSLHSLLQTLVERGWLETTNRGTIYGIGLRALRIGAAFLDRDPAVEAASVVLTNLRNHLDETFHLARLDESDVVYLVSKESMHHLRSSSRIGRRLPAHSTALGKALLAARPWEDVDALLPDTLVALTSETVTDRARLREELAETHARGWAVEHGQNTPGLGCFAVAVPSQHPPVDAISCSVPLVRLTEERAVEVVGALTHAADELGHMIWRG